MIPSKLQINFKILHFLVRQALISLHQEPVYSFKFVIIIKLQIVLAELAVL